MSCTVDGYSGHDVNLAVFCAVKDDKKMFACLDAGSVLSSPQRTRQGDGRRSLYTLTHSRLNTLTNNILRVLYTLCPENTKLV